MRKSLFNYPFKQPLKPTCSFPGMPERIASIEPHVPRRFSPQLRNKSFVRPHILCQFCSRTILRRRRANLTRRGPISSLTIPPHFFFKITKGWKRSARVSIKRTRRSLRIRAHVRNRSCRRAFLFQKTEGPSKFVFNSGERKNHIPACPDLLFPIKHTIWCMKDLLSHLSLHLRPGRIRQAGPHRGPPRIRLHVVHTRGARAPSW